MIQGDRIYMFLFADDIAILTESDGLFMEVLQENEDTLGYRYNMNIKKGQDKSILVQQACSTD